MKLTLAEASKKLKELNNEIQTLNAIEIQSREFLCAMGEDVESVRPEYDFKETQSKLDILKTQVRELKHKINIANINTKVDGYDMTIDEILVYIPQLSAQENKLNSMRGKVKKTRETGYNKWSNFVDYRYINYDLSEVNKEYNKVFIELSKAQMALDKTNNSVTIES